MPKKKAPSKKAPSGMTVQSQQDLVITRRPDFVAHYANNTGLLGTTFDLSLLFGRITDVKDGKVLIDQFIQITMSYQHAKAVAKILQENLAKYEQKHGPIPVGVTAIKGGAAPS